MASPLSQIGAGGRTFDVCNYLLLGLFSLSIALPFWAIVVGSFASPAVVKGLGFHFWNDDWRIEAWQFVFRENNIAGAYLNTMHRVVFGTVTTLFVTFTLAYPLSKRNLPGRTFFSQSMVFTLFFSGGIIPSYLLIRNLGMLNSRWSLILPLAFSAYYVIITRNFIMTIDQAVEDSAVVDGASYWTIMWRIIIPLSKPVLATIALWTAVAHWNAWFDALIYIHDREKGVLQLILRDVINRVTVFNNDEAMLRLIEELRRRGEEPDWARIPHEAITAAVIVITIGPIVLVYPWVQKYFVKGAQLGSLKG